MIVKYYLIVLIVIYLILISDKERYEHKIISTHIKPIEDNSKTNKNENIFSTDSAATETKGSNSRC